MFKSHVHFKCLKRSVWKISCFNNISFIIKAPFARQWKEQYNYAIMKSICSVSCLLLNHESQVHWEQITSQIFLWLSICFPSCFTFCSSLSAALKTIENRLHPLIADQICLVSSALYTIDGNLISSILQQISGGLQHKVSVTYNTATNHMQLETWYGPLPLLYSAQ